MNKTVDKTTIYLVRHGQSVGNLHLVFLGHTNGELTDFGVLQAETTAKALSDVDFAAIYSSDLVRAVKTAEPHAKMRGFSVNTSKNLREVYAGEWENRRVDDIINEYGEIFTVGWRGIFGEFTLPSGEYVPDAASRVEQELTKIASLHPGKNVLVASHAAVIRALWGKISGFEPCKWGEAFPYPTNASYSVVECIDGSLVPVSFSVDGHLSDLTCPTVE